MITIDRLFMRTGVAQAFAAGADVERWPAWLPHYRWVRFRERRADGGIVEMAAWRPFAGGLVNYPTWWVSDMTIEPGVPRVRYTHVDGITRGMEVVWNFAAEEAGTLVTITHAWKGPEWPVVGALAADLVIGPVFIHGIASRTLAGIARQAEAGQRGSGEGT